MLPRIPDVPGKYIVRSLQLSYCPCRYNATFMLHNRNLDLFVAEIIAKMQNYYRGTAIQVNLQNIIVNLMYDFHYRCFYYIGYYLNVILFRFRQIFRYNIDISLYILEKLLNYYLICYW